MRFPGSAHSIRYASWLLLAPALALAVVLGASTGGSSSIGRAFPGDEAAAPTPLCREYQAVAHVTAPDGGPVVDLGPIRLAALLDDDCGGGGGGGGGGTGGGDGGTGGETGSGSNDGGSGGDDGSTGDGGAGDGGSGGDGGQDENSSGDGGSDGGAGDGGTLSVAPDTGTGGDGSGGQDSGGGDSGGDGNAGDGSPGGSPGGGTGDTTDGSQDSAPSSSGSPGGAQGSADGSGSSFDAGDDGTGGHMTVEARDGGSIVVFDSNGSGAVRGSVAPTSDLSTPGDFIVVGLGIGVVFLSSLVMPGRRRDDERQSAGAGA